MNQQAKKDCVVKEEEHHYVRMKKTITKNYLIAAVDIYLKEEEKEQNQKGSKEELRQGYFGWMFSKRLEAYFELRDYSLTQDDKVMSLQVSNFIRDFHYRIGEEYLCSHRRLCSLACWATKELEKRQKSNEEEEAEKKLPQSCKLFKILALEALKDHVYAAIASSLIYDRLGVFKDLENYEDDAEEIRLREEPW